MTLQQIHSLQGRGCQNRPLHNERPEKKVNATLSILCTCNLQLCDSPGHAARKHLTHKHTTQHWQQHNAHEPT